MGEALAYELIPPQRVDDAIARHPIAFLPIGCLEYHGPHLPLGVDMLTAEAICRRTAISTGGVVLPPLWLAAGVLPLPHGISFPIDVLRSAVRSILTQLANSGFKVIILMSGHGALDHLHILREETDRVMAAHPGLRALTTMWNELNSDLEGDIHDHGAKVETSYMLEFHPETVDLSTLTPDPGAAHVGIYAANPRYTASRDWGSAMAAHAVERLSLLIRQMLQGEPADSWVMFRRLVERLQSGDLEVVAAGDDGAGVFIDFFNPHPQSKYVTAVEHLTLDDREIDLDTAAVVNPSLGEGHTDRTVTGLGPLSGFYVRTGQTMRLTIPGQSLDEEPVEIAASFRLADVLSIEAVGTVAMART